MNHECEGKGLMKACAKYRILNSGLEKWFWGLGPFVAVIVFLVIAQTAQAQRPREDDRGQLAEQELIEMGGSYYEGGNYFRAIIYFTKALARNPFLYEAYLGRGKAYLDLHQDDAALSDFSIAIKVDSKQADTYTWRAVCWYRKGKLKNMLSDCNKSIKLKPCQREAYLYRSAVWKETGQYGKAIQDVSKIVDCGLANRLVYSLRGEYCFNSGAYEQAVRDYSQAIELKPDAYILLEGRAEANRMLDKHDLAIADYTAVLEMAPKLPSSWVGRAMSYWKLGEYERAFNDFTKSLEYCEDCFSYYLNRGILQEDMGDHQSAISDLSKAISIDKANIKGYFIRGRLWEKTKKHGKARADYEMALKNGPDDMIPKAVLAWFLSTCPEEKYRDGARALELSKRVIDEEGEAAVLFAVLAAAQAELGNFKEAISAQEKGLILEQQFNNNEKQMQKYQTYLRSYNLGKPWRETRDGAMESLLGDGTR